MSVQEICTRDDSYDNFGSMFGLGQLAFYRHLVNNLLLHETFKSFEGMKHEQWSSYYFDYWIALTSVSGP